LLHVWVLFWCFRLLEYYLGCLIFIVFEFMFKGCIV